MQVMVGAQNIAERGQCSVVPRAASMWTTAGWAKFEEPWKCSFSLFSTVL